jgi:hypothetical protein
MLVAEEDHMQLGEIIATYDVALALRGESGKFEVTSPTGGTFHVTCKPNHSISNLEWSGNRSESQPFLIRKVAEQVSPGQGSAGTMNGEVQTKISRSPYLLGNQGEEDDAAARRDALTVLAKVPQDHSDGEGIADLDLQYLEKDPRTQQPSVCIYLKTGQQGRASNLETLITARCSSFNELDAEIRRLHAQLDEIRSRARKLLYRAQAIAVGA